MVPLIKQKVSAAIFIVLLLIPKVESQVPVDINSGNPVFPFPQFLPYENQTDVLGNCATNSPEGVCHAEMEKSTREAFQIMMNRSIYPGGGVGNVKYIYHQSSPSCTEGTGYAMLGAAIMCDKTTFDGLWLWAHDNAMNKVNRYDNGQPTSPDYEYSRLPGWQNKSGGNSAADGDFDMAMGLLIAYRQWGEFMGVSDASGNPISYKHDLIEFLQGLSDTLSYTKSNQADLISGDIGLDGYFKGGDTWTEMTDWASRNLPFGKPPTFKGGNTEHIDYTCPAYFHEFAKFLREENPQKYAWNIYQFERAEASSDWLMGQLYKQDPKNIPFAGWVDVKNDTNATFTTFADGEDFRLGMRTILSRMWNGNPTISWDPVNHSVIANKSNTFEYDIGKRYGKYLWDFRQSPWNLPGIKGTSGTYWGPSILKYFNTLQGTPMSTFTLNWVYGTGAPSAVISQDFNLMAEMYRFAEIEWDVEKDGDRYLTSVPKYFHDIFRVLAMVTLTGNYHAPSRIKPIANMKVYLDINKTFAFEGDTLQYTIDYRNYGSLDAQNVTIVDTLNKDFSFVSCTGGGTYDANSRTVTWKIGTVPGFKTSTGITPTKGTFKMKVIIKTATQKQYSNMATITCSNGYGWTSNQYPNVISPTMKRNIVDIAKHALVIEKKASVKKVNPGKDVIFSVSFLNSSTAGFLNGGRSGIHFSYSHNGTAPSDPSHRIRIRMFNDAQESYINYANYRVSYFLYDPGRFGIVGVNGNTNGWSVIPTITEGLVKNDITLAHEKMLTGSDNHGKWNQRVIVQFSDPTNPAIPDTNWNTIATITRFLEDQRGNSNRIHRGQTAPLRLEWIIATTGGVNAQWSDDWSWNPTASGTDQEMGFPITPDFTNPDPNNPGIPVTRLNPKHVEEISKTIDNILVEEWDGYTWRRVFGNSPMPGREISNVVFVDTVPSDFTFKEFVGNPPQNIKPTISGNIITWSIPSLEIGQGGTINYRATARDISPLKEKRVKNRAWIKADKESPISGETEVIITTDSLPAPPPQPTTMYKKADKNIYFPRDTINYQITYRQTHGSFVNSPTKLDDWTLVGGAAKFPIDNNGNILLNKLSTAMVHRYAHGKNGTVGGRFNPVPYDDFSLLLRHNGQTGNKGVEVRMKGEYAEVTVQCFNPDSVPIGPLYRATCPGYPGPFNFKVSLSNDTLNMWIGDTASPFPAITQTGITVQTGFTGVKSLNCTNDSLIGWHAHFDSGFDMMITDKLQYGTRFLSSTGKIVTGNMAGKSLDCQIKNDTLVWPIISGPTPMLANDSLIITIRGIVDTSLSPYIVNTAYTQIYGYPRDSIGCQVVSLFGGKNSEKAKLMASPSGGIFNDSVRVSLTASIKDITILYTTDGSLPSPSQIGKSTFTYTNPLLITKTTTITAIGFNANTSISDTLIELYTIVMEPVKLSATPRGGTYTDSVRVSLSSSAKNVTILYTTDGSMPDPSQIGKTTLEYTVPLLFTKTTTLRAIGFRSGSAVSDTLTEIYIIVQTEKPKLTAIPPGGIFNDSVRVTINSTVKNITILYTTDGSMPDPSQIGKTTFEYSVPLLFTKTTTLKAIGFRSGSVVSDTLNEIYIIVQTEKAKLTAIPPGGTFNDSVRVTINSTVKNITILYTLDGSMPDPAKAGIQTLVYNSPILITKSAILTAFGFRNSSSISDTLVEKYTIIPKEVILLTATPPGCVFGDSITVSLQANKPGIKIIYTTDGSTPSQSATSTTTKVYDKPLTLRKTTRLMALGLRNDSVLTPLLSERYKQEIPINLSITIVPNPAVPDSAFLPSWLKDKFSKNRGVVICIDPSHATVEVEAELQIYDPVGNKIVNFTNNNQSQPNIELYHDKQKNRLFFLWDCRTVYGRNIGYGSYISVISVTINKEQRYSVQKTIGIQRKGL